MMLDLSIIIPAYNRAELLRQTLCSLNQALQTLRAEIIVVDDGSAEPLEEQLSGTIDFPVRFIRQSNQGSLIARNHGLAHAIGKYVFFIDSDDQVHPDKFRVQIACLEKHQADVCYSDECVATINAEQSTLSIIGERSLPFTPDPVELYLKIQPTPGNLIFRREYITQHFTNPIVPPQRSLSPVGDIWIYYNLMIYPAKIVKVDQPYTIYIQHEQDRYSNCWEATGIASLLMTLIFLKHCPNQESTLPVRRQIGESALVSWRKLPRNFHAEFESKVLEIWKTAPPTSIENLGGRLFQKLAKLIGIENTARLLRRIQRPDYSKIQTLDRQTLNTLMQPLSNL
ncbi:glycosyltransferase family 2 protein [Leptolyngbya sp. GGD]|uniref:glycosyltransferase family 2 protein n=1 Tax=Leptolyngbya sp. GGD TaxID=2997907 RepID=UPI00227A21D4|nr:glycosyltransferase family 2 protein [Leptolyngbya sp. GGD]MCY6489306.1 glycosyltransferase family 2 protein [Leptolyngbya sp. GGD]